jgi:hypothetical protein
VANGLPARLRSLTFGGADVQKSDISLHLDIQSGLNDGLEVRGTDSLVPGLDGMIARDRKRSVRHIVLSGLIQGTGSTESLRQGSYQNLCDYVEETFQLDGSPAVLVGQARDGTWRHITARTTNIVWDDEPVFGVGDVSVFLDSVDPDWDTTGGGS